MLFSSLPVPTALNQPVSSSCSSSSNPFTIQNSSRPAASFSKGKTHYERFLERENSRLKKDLKKSQGLHKCAEKRANLLEKEKVAIKTKLDLYVGYYNQAYAQLQRGQGLNLHTVTPELIQTIKNSIAK